MDKEERKKKESGREKKKRGKIRKKSGRSQSPAKQALNRAPLKRMHRFPTHTYARLAVFRVLHESVDKI